MTYVSRVLAPILVVTAITHTMNGEYAWAVIDAYLALNNFRFRWMGSR